MVKQQCACDDTKHTRNYYRYYDTPDGCDVMKKAMVTTRYGITAGLIIGTFDVLMFSHAVGLVNILGRYMKHALPLGLMGTTFALVANGLQEIRQADDAHNYFAGGFACGPLLSLWLGSKHAILLGGLGLGVIGFIKKTGVDECWTFLPMRPDHMNSVTSWRRDYSIVADPKDAMLHTCKPKK